MPPEHPNSYYNVSDRLVEEIDGRWKPNQYANEQNPLSHYEQTGPELSGTKQTDASHTSWRGWARVGPSPVPGGT